MSKNEIRYIAINPTGDENAAKSARSALVHMPDLHVTMFTDQSITMRPPFSEIIRVPSRSAVPGLTALPRYPNQGIIAKVRYMYQGGLDNCIFLDYDTYINDSLDSVFELLDNGIDLALVIDNRSCGVKRWYSDVPDCLPIFNSGMVAFRRTPLMEEFFAHYWDLFRDITLEGVGLADQITLTKAIWDYRDKIHYVTLQPEYNLRFVFPVLISGKVKVLHGWEVENIPAVAKRMDKNTHDLRVWFRERLLFSHRPVVGLIEH